MDNGRNIVTFNGFNSMKWMHELHGGAHPLLQTPPW